MWLSAEKATYFLGSGLLFLYLQMKIHETHLPVRASALETDKNPVEVAKIFQRAESLSNPAAFNQVTGNVAINVEKKNL